MSAPVTRGVVLHGGDSVSSPTPQQWSTHQSQQANGRVGGSIVRQAANSAASGIGAHVTAPGCSNVGAIKDVNNFLSFGGGLGSAAVIGAAALGGEALLPGPGGFIAGAGAAAAIASFQTGTQGGCGTRTPLAPAMVTPGAPPVDTAISGVLGSGAGADGPTDDFIAQNMMFPCAYNRLFWVSIGQYDIRDSPQVYNDLGSVSLSSRNSGEATVDWLNRIRPFWGWTEDGDGTVRGNPPDEGRGSSNEFAVWVWDAWGSALIGAEDDAPGWRKDFAKYYKFHPGASSDWWSVLGILAAVISAQGITSASQPFPPITE